MDTIKVGKTIAFLRSYYGMTQRELANRLGVTDKAVSRWERGQGIPDTSLLTKLSIILDTDIESILEGNLTQRELNWKGILELNYPDGIYADTQMFSKCFVYFQIGFFLLAGINEICVRGIKRDIDFTEDRLGDGEPFGIKINYETVKSRRDELSQVSKTKIFHEYYQCGGVMVIDGLDFLYGKDVTKSFRRIIYDSKIPVRLVNFRRKPTSICFYPPMGNVEKRKKEDLNLQMKNYILERGVITFPIKTNEDILDASMLIRILEKHQGERVGDLEEIAIRRTLIPGARIDQL